MSGTQMRAIVDMLLTNVAKGYAPKNYISESILPVIQSAQTTGKLGSYGTAHLRIVNTVRGGKGKFREVDSTSYSTSGYEIEGHGISDLVTKEDYKNVIEPFRAEEDKVMALSNILWLEKEKGLADQLGNTAVLTQNTTLVGNAQYSDPLNSQPVQDFQVARAAVYDGCGEVPNLAIMSWDVKNILKYHPQLLDLLGYKFARPGGLSDEELARALDVDKVLIGTAKYESAKEGQTSVLSSVWGKNIVFAVAPEKPQIMQVSLGYTVRYEGESPRKAYKEAQFDPPGSTKILVEDNYDQLFTNVGAAYLIKNAVA